MKTKLITSIAFSFLSLALFFSCTGPDTKPDAKTVVENNKPDYKAIGKNRATETQAVLAKNLVGAVNKGGTEFALEFCNTKAMPLTDSMAHLLSTSLKRVTDKPRNSANQANENELAYIKVLKDKMEKGESPEAKMIEIEGKMVGYYPIITNNMCLSCHGKKDININAATFKKINKLYPADKAIGYKENEIRGLWVVEMKKNKN